MGEFDDRVVLIIGAGQGEGPSLAQAFAQQGATLALQDVTPIHVDRVVAAIGETGGQAKAYVGDPIKKIAIQTILEDVLADWGQIDVLITNGLVKPRACLLDMDEWDWRRAMDANLGAPFLVMQSVGRIMREQGGGVMINVIGDDQPADEPGQRIATMTSQLGLVSLTREAAGELAAHHIRVHAVSRSLASLLLAAGLRQDAVMVQQGLKTIPRDRRRDLIRLVLHLASDAAIGLTGLVLDAPFLG